jgi:hypothetical protein
MTFDEWFFKTFESKTWVFSKESIKQAYEDGVAEGLKQRADREPALDNLSKLSGELGDY